MPRAALRLATRASALAPCAGRAGRGRRSPRAIPACASSSCSIRTSGDRLRDVSLATRRRQGSVRQGDRGGAARRARSTPRVHSMKDLPAALAAGLAIGARSGARRCRATCCRCSTRRGLAGSRPGARVGTASVRRRAQLLARPPGPRGRAAARQRRHAAPASSRGRRARRDRARRGRARAPRPRRARAPGLSPPELLPGGRAGRARDRDAGATTRRRARLLARHRGP